MKTIIVLFLLAASSLILTTTRSDGYSKKTVLPAAQSISFSAGYFIPLEIDTFSNSSLIVYYVSSNVSISTALMNSQQFNVFNNTQTDDISNALSNRNGTVDNEDIQVSSGAYYLVFYDAAQSGTANVTFSYEAYPVTPYVAGPMFPPEPTGLASFGINNDSGNAVPYVIKTNSIVGTANISAIQAHNSSAPSLNDTVSGATLQLNAILVVNQNGTQYNYWAQNTPDFVTDESQISFGDNLWNNSDVAGFLSNQTVTSPNGNSVYQTNDNGTAQYYYGYGTNNFTYAEPFDIRLLMNDSVLPSGVLLQMGAQVLLNGSGSAQPINWYDNITIKDPGVQSAYFYVSGNDSTPIGSYYDAELVFAGEGNLEATNFTQMDSTLGLYYLNSSSNDLSAFPSYYSFGGDTGEATYNLHVQYIGNGSAQVTVGTPNYVYLNSVSTSFTSTSSVVQLSSTSSSYSPSTSNQSSSGASNISSNYILGIVTVSVILIVLGVFASIRKSSLGRN
jgi:thermopsin